MKINDLTRFKKLAIMGGTFNPIHNAHLLASEYVLERFNIDKIIFIPTGMPPHKNRNILASPEDRYNMVLLATLDNPNFIVSSIELERKTITYTIDTLMTIKELCNDDTELYFIVGTDTINQVYSWKDQEEIFKICKFIIVTRPDYIMDKGTKGLLEHYKDRIYFCEIPLLSISSTIIRKMIKQDKNISYLLPESVKNYIYKNELYKIDYFCKYKKEIEKLKENLSEKRFNHSLEVAKEAKNLAIQYDFDEEKAFLAGILHDCCKCFGLDKIYEVCDKFSFEMDDVLKKQPDLAHSFLGYFIAKEEYGIEDNDILNSIKYHTTGKENMTLLEKIIYIADYIEPTRAHFDGIEKARELAYINIDIAMEKILKDTIEYNEAKGRLIHPLSKYAYYYYKNLNKS